MSRRGRSSHQKEVERPGLNLPSGSREADRGRKPRWRRSGRRAQRKRPAHATTGGKALGARAGGTATSCEHRRRSPGSTRAAQGRSRPRAPAQGGAGPREAPPPGRVNWFRAAPGLSQPSPLPSSGPRAPRAPRRDRARSLGRALLRPPVWSARARRRPDDAAVCARLTSLAPLALGFPGYGTRSQPARVQPRSGGGEKSRPEGWEGTRWR